MIKKCCHIIAIVFLLGSMLSACSMLEFLAPDRVEQALSKIQIKYGSLLDKAIDYRRLGLLNDSSVKALTKVFDRFDSVFSQAAQAQTDAEQDSDNLNQYIDYSLQEAGLEDLHKRYLEARQRALDRAGDLDGFDLDEIVAENQLKRAVWNELSG